MGGSKREMRAKERMPCQQAAHKNGFPPFVKMHKSARACPKTYVVSRYSRNKSPAILLIYDPKHIKKSKLVNDLPP